MTQLNSALSLAAHSPAAENPSYDAKITETQDYLPTPKFSEQNVEVKLESTFQFTRFQVTLRGATHEAQIEQRDIANEPALFSLLGLAVAFRYGALVTALIGDSDSSWRMGVRESAEVKPNQPLRRCESGARGFEVWFGSLHEKGDGRRASATPCGIQALDREYDATPRRPCFGSLQDLAHDETTNSNLIEDSQYHSFRRVSLGCSGAGPM